MALRITQRQMVELEQGSSTSPNPKCLEVELPDITSVFSVVFYPVNPVKVLKRDSESSSE